MKIALCLHGYFNNRADSRSGYNGYNHIKEKIFEKCEDVDVFIHSWEPDKREMLGSMYSPKLSIFEEQMLFDHLDEEQKRIDEGFARGNSKFAACKLSSTLSFLYSRKKSVELKQQYEKENDFVYDVVIVARFDLGQRDKFGKWKWYVSRVSFDPDLDMNHLYTSMWDQLNAGYPDQWFYGSSEIIDKLATIYDKVPEYMNEGSDYEKNVMQGWPDSQPIDNMSSTDTRQLSNEVLKPKNQRSKTLMRYPRWQMINNHILHKWFCIDAGLYEKTKYVYEENGVVSEYG